MRLILVTLCLLCSIQAAHAQQTFTNPIKAGAADPHIYFKDGVYYFLYTTGDGVWVRSHADFSKVGEAHASKVWGWNHEIKGHVWAPEIAHLNGRWYIYASGSLRSDRSWPEDMRMFVLEAQTGDPLGQYAYKGLLSDKSAIDASVWQNPENQDIWITWSQWAPEQSIYIAKMSSPTTIARPRRKISSPTNAWERDKWPVNEGSAFLPYGDKMHIVMSVNGCASPDYSLALLTANKSDNWLNPQSWKKSDGYVFTKSPERQVFGTGHHSTFRDPNGNWWLAYHAVTDPNGGCDGRRSTRIQRFDFDSQGFPRFATPTALGTSVEIPAQPVSQTGGIRQVRLENILSGKLMDVSGLSMTAGADIHQWEPTGGPNQVWEMRPSTDGSHQLKAKHSGLCLDLPGGASANGTPIIQWACHGGNNQKWRFEKMGDAYRIRSLDSGKCLDVEAFRKDNGARIHLWDCHDGLNQRWRIRDLQ